MKKLFMLWVILWSSWNVYAAQDVYQFATSEQSQRFEQLTSQLRCLVCQNQTLAESNAPLANDLRKQIFEKISHGQTDIEILDYLVTRYGNFILYNPPLNSETWLLWFAPALLLLGGLFYLLYYLRKNRERSNAIII
ncbi:MAG: cytochrome c-type biogenesis protein [Pseudomonadota bacterium]